MKNCWAEQFSKTLISIRFNLLQFCPSVWHLLYLLCYQYVRIGDVVSQSLPVDHGVPQGSILGPVLVAVHINDLLTVPKLCQTACYVDDSKLYLKFKTNELCNEVSAVNPDLGGVVTIHCL